MKTKLEIIDETAQAYADPSNRGYDKRIGNCTYINSAGKKCAIGRVAIDPYSFPAGTLNRHVGGIWKIDYLIFTDDLLQEEYRGHDPEFWQDLQEWHDCEGHFDTYTISPGGDEELNRLREKWADP